jgi:hypothetical protein
MSIFDSKINKSVAEAVMKVMQQEELKGNQHKIDANKNGKVDAHDFKLLRAKKGMKEEVKKNEYHIAGKHKFPTKDEHAVTVKHTESGREHVHSGKGKYLSKLIKSRYDINHHFESVELDEAFPTVDDAKKRMAAGKTATGSVTKTKTGLVHKRDYKDDDNDAEDTQKASKKTGARQNNFNRGKSTGYISKPKAVKEETKLSFTEMLQLYNEAGLEVIAKIVPEKVEFGDIEVEVFDADKINGTIETTVVEEVDNETFTKEVEAQKEKNAGRGKKAEVAKASVQAVKQEEVELEEGDTPYNDQLSLRGVTAPGAPMDNRHGHKKSGTGAYFGGNKPRKATLAKATDALKTNIKNSLGKHPKPNLPEEVEQIDELKKSTVASYIQKKFGKMSDEPVSKNQYGYAKKDAKGIQRAGLRMSGIKATQKEEVEQIDEISKSTLGSYIKKASHDVAAKGAFTRHFADKSRAETAEQKHDIARKTMKKADKMQDAGMKRRANMAKAVDRLTKEDVEQLDEKLPASASAGDYIHDFVHSDNPKFEGKSTKERQKMALGAFYAKNKGK